MKRKIIRLLAVVDAWLERVEAIVKRYPRAVIFFTITLIIALPAILSNKWFFLIDFKNTGPIGDTIGGITAPFIGILSALLVYYALKAQVKANKIIQNQIDAEGEIQKLNQLYIYLNESINNFRFRSLSIGYTPIKIKDEDGKFVLAKGQREFDDLEFVEGALAFSNFFEQINCNFHGEIQSLECDPAVSEVFSILITIDLILDRLEKSTSVNSDIIKILVKHQFYYRVISTIRKIKAEDLAVSFCDNCNRNHGLPKDVLDLIEKIKSRMPIV